MIGFGTAVLGRETSFSGGQKSTSGCVVDCVDGWRKGIFYVRGTVSFAVFSGEQNSILMAITDGMIWMAAMTRITKSWR